MTVVVRRVSDGDDLIRAGALVRAAYEALPGHPADPEYDSFVADVAGRVHESVVIVAVDDPAGADGPRIVGCLTFVPGSGNQHFEFDDDDAASFRYFGVDSTVQRRGIGEAMVRWCIDEARRGGRRRLRIHTLVNMVAAQRLYERIGFVRDPSTDEDWDGIIGLGYRYDIPTEGCVKLT